MRFGDRSQFHSKAFTNFHILTEAINYVRVLHCLLRKANGETCGKPLSMDPLAINKIRSYISFTRMNVIAVDSSINSVNAFIRNYCNQFEDVWRVHLNVDHLLCGRLVEKR